MLSALIFLYRNVLYKELDLPTRLITAKCSTHLPTVVTPTEVRNVLQYVGDTAGMIARLFYDIGMRLHECLRLRVKDIDFGNHRIIVRSAEGANGRSTLLPETLIEPLQFHLKTTQLIHQKDLKEGYGETLFPFALNKKYPNAGKEWVWQYVFPASQLSTDSESGVVRRHQYHPSEVQKTVRRAAQKAGLDKRVTPYTFKHSFATHLLEAGYDIRTIQELLGHKDVKTTMIYTHILNRGSKAGRSPLDNTY